MRATIASTPMLAKLGARPAGSPWTPSAAVSFAPEWRRSLRTRRGIDGKRERCIGKSRVRADLAVAVAALLQRLHEGGLRSSRSTRRWRARGHRMPSIRALSRVADRLQILLIAAVIAEKHDVAKAGELQAATGRFQRCFEGRIGDADGSGKAHVTRWRIHAAFGRVGDDRRDEALPSASAIFSASNRARTLCLPSVMCGPFCSVPPIGTRTIVAPAAMRSRSSVHVRSSRATFRFAGACAAARDADEHHAERPARSRSSSRRPCSSRHLAQSRRQFFAVAGAASGAFAVGRIGE